MASCGPSYEEREQAREAERQRTLASSRQALADFAKTHGAIPVELFDDDPLDQLFTAQLQHQLEGKVVAFRSGLLDIVRTSTNDYELVLGDPFLRGTMVMLRASEDTAAKFLTQPPDRLSSFLVVAEIDQVEALTLKLESCREPDCTEVKLEPNLFGSYHRISGRAITMQLEKPAASQ